MAKKAETQFRQGRVIPFLKTLKNTKYTPIQQVALNGDPDFILCIRGRYVDLELKKAGEVPSPLQVLKMMLTNEAGGLAFVASPVNWKEVKQELLKLDQGEKYD